MMQISTCKVLAFHMTEEEIRQLTEALELLKIPVRVVTEEQEQVPLGLLAGARGWKPEMRMPGPELSEPMIVLAGFNNRQLDTVLELLRKKRVPGVLKAILTEFNAAWTARQLQVELKQEREAMGKGKRAHRSVQ